MNLKLEKKGIIPAVNFHIWKPCNYKCKFCFGTFNDTESFNLKKDDALAIIKQLSDFGFRKITFSGGEPLLCPFLNELIKFAKQLNLKTCVVTNGSLLNKKWLEENTRNLDWLALSIDSIQASTNIKSGRVEKMNAINFQDEIYYSNLIKQVRKFNVKLKINTVVSSFNIDENLNNFINRAKPERWKIFQALPIKDQNDNHKDFSITLKKYKAFLNRHRNNQFIKESNYDMKGSYVMIDPLGRFFENTEGKHKYSEKINKIGVENALKEMNYSFKKFINRDGLYEW
jgi:radical S-adenosyl methionine domain-containing protein 2